MPPPDREGVPAENQAAYKLDLSIPYHRAVAINLRTVRATQRALTVLFYPESWEAKLKSKRWTFPHSGRVDAVVVKGSSVAR